MLLPQDGPAQGVSLSGGGFGLVVALVLSEHDGERVQRVSEFEGVGVGAPAFPVGEVAQEGFGLGVATGLFVKPGEVALRGQRARVIRTARAAQRGEGRAEVRFGVLERAPVPRDTSELALRPCGLAALRAGGSPVHAERVFQKRSGFVVQAELGVDRADGGQQAGL